MQRGCENLVIIQFLVRVSVRLQLILTGSKMVVLAMKCDLSQSHIFMLQGSWN